MAALNAGQDEAAVTELRRFQPQTHEEWKAAIELWGKIPRSGADALEALGPVRRLNDPELILMAAKTLIAKDRLGDGVVWLQEGVARFPGQTELLVECVKVLGRLGRHDRSAALLAGVAGNDPRLLNLLGNAQLLGGKPEEAKANFERSVAAARAHGRDYAPPHYHLGLYFEARGEWQAAMEEFRTAAAASPDHLESRYRWLATAEKLNDAVEAGRARDEFRRVNEARLERLGALRGLGPDPQPAVVRTEDIEARPVVAEPVFRRSFPAGSSLEFGTRAPGGASARFSAEIVDGPGQGQRLLDVVEQAEGPIPRWTPHRVNLPEGASSASVEFRVGTAGKLAGLFGGATPSAARFSEPGVIGPALGRSQDRRPNILLISLDTLRADRLGSYGAGRPTSPTIDKLAAEGVRFDRAEAPSNWTLPSHYSMLSGLSAISHGVMPDLGILQGFLYPDRLFQLRGSGKEVMLAEALTGQGYRTAGVTEDGWVSAKFGFGQGFRLYRSADAGSLPGTVAGALAELETTGSSGPWFLFVHTYAPHQPYHAPREFRSRFAHPGHVGFAWPAAQVPIEDFNRFHDGRFAPAESDIRGFGDLYDGQVAWADSMVEKLVDWLRRKGLLEQTIVVVTSDHGEELFERGRLDHGETLFEEVTRIPLIIFGPGRIPGGRVITAPTTLIDLPATLLELAGGPGKLGEGTSLAPLWSSTGGGGGRLVYSDAKAPGGDPMIAIWEGNLKYIRRGTGSRATELLFDLGRDAAERKDLAATRPADIERFRRLAAEHCRTGEQAHSILGMGEEQIDQETLEQLKSIGYVR